MTNRKTRNAYDYLYVALQIALFVCYILPFEFMRLHFPAWFRIMSLLVSGIGLAVVIFAILQLNTNLTPFPSPKKNSYLVQSGLYRYIRHPIYTGIILLLLGYALYIESLYRLTILILLWILFYFKTVYEEKALIQKFPDYKEYKVKTGQFWPLKR